VGRQEFLNPQAPTYQPRASTSQDVRNNASNNNTVN
jgi:hypothetical protein